MDNMKSTITIIKILASLLGSFQKRNLQAQMLSLVNLIKYLKARNSNPIQSFPENRRGGNNSQLTLKASMTLYKNKTKTTQENYRPITLMNIDTKS